MKLFSKILKLLIIITIIFGILTSISDARVVPAEGLGGGGGSSSTESFSDWQQQADDFLEKGKNEQKISTQDAITILLPAGRLLVGIATIVLVIVGSIMGVKYMIAGANEKAQLKQKLIYYIISVVLVYGAIGIFSLVVGLMNSILA